MERKLRTAEIVVKGKVLHLIYGYRDFGDLYFNCGEFFADNYDSFEFFDVLDGKVSFDDTQWYHFVDGWLYESQLFGGEISRMNNFLEMELRPIDASLYDRLIHISDEDNFNFE